MLKLWQEYGNNREYLIKDKIIMKNKITLLIIAGVMLFCSSSCFVTVRERRAHPSIHDKDYVQPPDNGTRTGSIIFRSPDMALVKIDTAIIN